MAWQAYAALAGYQLITSALDAEYMAENAKFQREIAELNAQYAEIDAYEAEQEGMSRENRYQSVIDQTIGAQKVAYASQNVDFTSGTAQAVIAESKLNGFLNQMDIRNQAHQRALGYKTEARSLRLRGFMAEQEGIFKAEATRRSGIIDAAKIGLSGYENYKNSKPRDIGLNSSDSGLRPVEIGSSYSSQFKPIERSYLGSSGYKW